MLKCTEKGDAQLQLKLDNCWKEACLSYKLLRRSLHFLLNTQTLGSAAGEER